MNPSIKAGISGFLVAIVINLFSPVYLDFVPSFLAAILVIFVYGLDTFRDGLVAAFMTYIFNEGILGTLSLATFYVTNESYPSFNVDIFTVFYPIVNAVSAFIAGYVGIMLVHKMKPTRELPSPPPLPPPMQPV